jgi:hypothetical protein
MTQLNQITLSVNDDGDDGTTPNVDEVYDNLRRSDFRGEYIAENHTSLSRDMMTLYATPPKPTSTFYGVDKAALKFTVDAEVDAPNGTTTRSPGIIQVSTSLPVGVTDAFVEHLRQKLIAAASSDWFLELVRRGMV